MSSLLATASNWTNDDGPPKKRTSTFRNVSNTTMNPTNIDSGSSDNKPANLTTYNDENDERNVRVNNVINQMSNIVDDNDGNKLANYMPIPNPMPTVNKDQPIMAKIDQHSILNPTNDFIPKFNHGNNNDKSIYDPTKKINTSGTFVMNPPNGSYSNYNTTYENKPIFLKTVGNSVAAGSLNDNKLLEKINYMIHLLEQQQNEKTANITEEFILYTFLGVFIIFVVDSFTKTGKYVR